MVSEMFLAIDRLHTPGTYVNQSRGESVFYPHMYFKLHAPEGALFLLP